MECEFCHKTYSTIYVLQMHQRTTKSCLRLQGKQSNAELNQCSYCKKSFTIHQSLVNHLLICKKKKEMECQQQQIDQLRIKRLEETTREIKYTMEDEIDRMSSDIRQSKDEFEQELRHKDQQIAELKTLLEQQQHIQQTPLTTVINNHNHTHWTIYNYMTPERVSDIFDKHYTINTLMDGQKGLANFVVDHFILGKEKMIYLCVDKSRKKCMITTDFENFHEDINNEILLSHLTPAFRIIKGKVVDSEFEKKYNLHVTKIHEGYDEILAIRTDGTNFRAQLCRRLHSTIEDKERLDLVNDPLHSLDTLREEESTNFTERKEEIDRIEEHKKYPSTEIEVPLVLNHIGGVSLGRLDILRKAFQERGVFTVCKDLRDVYENDKVLASEYDDYIKHGIYKGIVQ